MPHDPDVLVDVSGPGPRKGETIALCAHLEQAVHYHRIEPPKTAVATDGTRIEVRWVCLCAPCHHAPGLASAKCSQLLVLEEDEEVLRIPRGGQA